MLDSGVEAPGLVNPGDSSIRIHPLRGVARVDVQILKKNIYTNNMIENLDKFTAKRKKLVERKGKHSTPPCLVIFEDSTNEVKLMNSRSFNNCFVLLRHLNCSVISVVLLQDINRKQIIIIRILFAIDEL